MTSECNWCIEFFFSKIAWIKITLKKGELKKFISINFFFIPKPVTYLCDLCLLRILFCSHLFNIPGRLMRNARLLSHSFLSSAIKTLLILKEKGITTLHFTAYKTKDFWHNKNLLKLYWLVKLLIGKMKFQNLLILW